MYKESLFRQIRRIPRTVEPVGIIPRSLIRAVNRFFAQLLQTTNVGVIEEFRISRYQILVSFQSISCLIFFPWLARFLATSLCLRPITSYLWNGQQEDIFLNGHFEQQALEELEHFEEQLFFEYMLTPYKYNIPDWSTYSVQQTTDLPMILKAAVQQKTTQLARQYNDQSVDCLTCFFADLVSAAIFGGVVITLRPQILIFKSFVVEFFYSLSDTIKSVLLILATNLLVGFHSPRGWELLLEAFLNRFGFPAHQDFVFIFVATFPVLLDTVFKYWVFRYLNKISPSTVATYHAMIQ
jgi:CemA family